ncbi:TMV resistance protein N-like protein, partial [Tanacetum coccineum]
GESHFINKIVLDILAHINPNVIENNLIGIETHIDALNSLLDLDETEEVRMVGIWGMGGIGKTTIAQAMFRRISYKFDGSSFVKDVRQNCSNKKDVCALQQKILSDVLMINYFMIKDPDEGAETIKDRFYKKKVLLVLDDMDNPQQKEFLAETNTWFGPGSRIIITTRNQHLLSDAYATYKPNILLLDQAVELFCRHAFKTNIPPDDYKELSYRAVGYAGYLPLALKVLGSFFYGRHIVVWESSLNRLAKEPNIEIFKTLKLSYDGLHLSEKKIFLDIACFFKCKDKEHVNRILDSFGFDPVIGISVLIEKSLITVSKKRLEMHDLIQEMGCQIVRDFFTNSRIWELEEMQNRIIQKTKCVALDHRLTIGIPGNHVPIWFKESWNGCNALLKLPPRCHGKIRGFVLCGVFHRDWHSQYASPQIIFNIVNKEKVIPMKEAHIEGNLVMTIMRTDGAQSARCGAHIVYKEYMESVQESTTWISDYGNMLQVDGDDYQEHPDYDTIVLGNLYVYEDKSDEEKFMLLIESLASSFFSYAKKYVIVRSKSIVIGYG